MHHTKIMKTLFPYLVAMSFVLLTFTFISTYAAVPEIAQVPQNLPAAAQTEFNQRSERLHTWRDSLKAKIDAFNARPAVKKNSAADRTMSNEEAKLNMEKGSLIKAI